MRDTPAGGEVSMVPETFETHPSRYQHWKVAYDGAICRLTMDVREDGGLGGYRWGVERKARLLEQERRLRDSLTAHAVTAS